MPMSDNELDYWLDEAHRHRNDYPWLDKNGNKIYEAVLLGIYSKGARLNQATGALFAVSRYMLTRMDYRRWWKLYLDALVFAGDSKNYHMFLEIFARLGQGYLIDGKVESARRAFLRVIRDAKDDPSAGEQVMLAYIGLIKVESWDYSSEYDERIQEALALSAQLKDRLLTDLLYQALAAAYAHRNQTEQAIGYSLTALGYSFNRRDYLQAAMNGIILASAYRKRGLMPQAQQALRFVRSILEHVDHPQVFALAAYEQGVVCYYEQDYAQAEKWIHQAHAAFYALTLSRHVTMTTHMLGNIYIESGEFDLAEAKLKQAFEEWQALDNIYEQTSVFYDLGNLANRRGDRTQAQRYLNEALALSAHIPQPDTQNWLVNLILDFRQELAPGNVS